VSARPRDAARSREVERIDRLIRGFPRSCFQVNRPHESDAELLRLPDVPARLAVTVDTVVEEIETGLYGDPEVAGRIAVLAAASDLAAVGAEPVGVLLSLTLPRDSGAGFEDRLRDGLLDGCRTTGLALLGGDTSVGCLLSIGVTALGLVGEGPALTRLGGRPGDALYASGPLGLGSAFALAALGLVPSSGGPDFRPAPRLRHGAALRGVATCCIDSSDGLLAALDELATRNRVGIRIDGPLGRLLHPEAREAVGSAGLSAWMLLAGPHGEFELVFAVPEERVRELRAAAQRLGWKPLRLGVLTSGGGVRVAADGDATDRILPTDRLRDLFEECGGDPAVYLARLRELELPAA
jgi:thiamine-monophosphate kinase